jgi:hypothetical protein
LGGVASTGCGRRFIMSTRVVVPPNLSTPRMQTSVIRALWAIFALLLVTGGILLLYACELRIPSLMGLRFCPTPFDWVVLDQQVSRRHELDNQIHTTELALAQIAPCVTTEPPIAPEPPRPTIPEPTPPEQERIGHCDDTNRAGENEPETINIDVSGRSGMATFSWQMFNVKDRMKVYLDGRMILDTMCVSGGGSRPIRLPARARTVRVDVQPNCEGANDDTKWNFTLACPTAPGR